MNYFTNFFEICQAGSLYTDYKNSFLYFDLIVDFDFTGLWTVVYFILSHFIVGGRVIYRAMFLFYYLTFEKT